LTTTDRFGFARGLVRATKFKFDFSNSKNSQLQLGEIQFFGPNPPAQREIIELDLHNTAIVTA